MKKNVDLLEIIELIQLRELVEAGIIRDKSWISRMKELSSKYTEEDVASVSIKAAKNFSDMTGFLKKQVCTNKECGFSFFSEDYTETCDICFHPTLRVLN